MQANAAVANAYVADITPPRSARKRFGMLGAMFGIGFILGPAMGGLLGGIDIHLPFFVAGGLALANWPTATSCCPNPCPRSAGPFDWWRANPCAALRNWRR
jgi:DHA1 family tetracycline resistance protein-like MFS transporter